MDDDAEPILSRTSEEIYLQDITAPATSTENIEDAQDRIRSTEDGNDLQCSSAQNYIGSNVDREPIFVIVDSSCISNPSSKEILITKINIVEESPTNKNPKNKVIPVDTPCTSKSFAEFISTQNRAYESIEELEMIDINLQSDNEILLNAEELDNDPESIVLAYLREKDTLLERDELASKISEHSLDVRIPSYPGSPRSIDLRPVHSLESFNDRNPHVKHAIEFLHKDKEFLVAAEIGNNKLLDVLIRNGTDLQQIDHLGRNALHLAVCTGNIKAVKVLLDAGVNPNIKDNLGMTPLSLSLMRRPSTVVANLLFDHGALLMPRSDPMDTGLFIQFVMMCIPTSEEENILRLLVDKGAIINDPEAPGKRQALHFAAMSNNTNLIRILIALGANLYMKNHRGETPKNVAEIFACKEAFELLSDLEETEVVLIPSVSNLSLL